jgi:gliding motility-associated-like protein
VVDIIRPSLDIAEQDSTICKGEPVTLHALGIPENNYLWGTGSTEGSIVINGAGTYTVQATTICGVMYDSVLIAEEICNCDAAFVPNAFSPNGDGRNDILEVRLQCPRLEDYAFTIYNRYGQKMYQSAWPGQGWDGYHNGAPADLGTYFFYLRYKDNAGKETIKRGDIMLLR